MWIIKIYAYFSIVPFYTVQNSGCQIAVNYQVVVCQLLTYRLYPYRIDGRGFKNRNSFTNSTLSDIQHNTSAMFCSVTTDRFLIAVN